MEVKAEDPHFLLASFGSALHTLTLPSAGPETSGEFVCEAYNDFGDTDTFCLVAVKGRRQSVTSDTSIYDINL